MVMRVHSNSPRTSWDVNGRESLAISKSIDGSERYRDWLVIEHYAGSVSFKGNHVHDLISSIIRFSTPNMRKHYRNLLNITDKVTGKTSKDIHKFSEFQIKCEKGNREHQQKFNERLRQDIIKRMIEDKAYELW